MRTLLFFLVNTIIYAQTDSLKIIKLDEVEIKTFKLSKIPLEIPASLSVKKISSNWLGSSNSIQEYLNDLAGISSFNYSNYAQDIRLSIRGFGARSAFGIRGIKIVVDGIPETTPDGQGQMDNLPLRLIRQIEVMRGPNALRFGNASGGVLAIETLMEFEKSFQNVSLFTGNYSQKQFNFTSGLKLKKTMMIFHLNHFKGEGYRSHSRFETNQFNARIRHKINEKTFLHTQLNLTNSPYAEDAGGQTITELNEHRNTARKRNLTFRSGERINQVKLGSTLNYTKGNSKIVTYGFLNLRSFEGYLPFTSGGVVDLKRFYSGAGSELKKTYNFENKEMTFVVGFSLNAQQDKRERFDNNNGKKGSSTLDQWESYTSLGAFFITQVKWNKWLFNGGIRGDNNRLRVRDVFFINGDDSDERKLTAWSPQVGISFSFTKDGYLFANIAQSYETPSLSELSANPNGQGGFNSLIGIQNARNFEIGIKKKNRSLKWSISAYRIETKNDLVPYELESFPNRTFYRNAGSTLRLGIEGEIRLFPSPNWNIRASYNINKFSYLDYVINSIDFREKILPGIPLDFGGISITRKIGKGFELFLNNQYRGTVYTNDNNTTKTKGFVRTDFTLQIPLKIKTKKIQLNLGVNNLSNQLYSDNIRINAFGGRYYEAAPERNFFARANYQF